MQQKHPKTDDLRKMQIDRLTDFVLKNKTSLGTQRIVSMVLHDKNRSFNENDLLEFRAQVGRLKSEDLDQLMNLIPQPETDYLH
ncbi:hypothetical protein [Candidatus Formimonas warabiya]|uniref:Uncharacterized protein n=1 Tax=Formimonas warabiya TaxID=1761012 RepID=A0A3G1KVC2_FORW1|nr:hypothetical protein [Candidatus Formimonas warabiya]ATW26350.1 hypothetical protein DCMF_17695 [Candidatus Formimonas warabiya]